jgi:hypothetical protein
MGLVLGCCSPLLHDGVGYVCMVLNQRCVLQFWCALHCILLSDATILIVGYLLLLPCLLSLWFAVIC